MKWIPLLLIYSISIFLACGNEVSSETEPTEEDTFVHPATPEEVVKQFQTYLDNNQFDLAKRLSTPAEQDVLNFIEKTVADQPLDSTLMHTDFINIVCDKQGKQANCIAVIEEEGEQMEEYFNLMQIQGKWYVHTNEEEGELQYDTTIEEEFE